MQDIKEPTKLKIAFVTEEPTLKGHKRNTCAQMSLGFDDLEQAERFVMLACKFIEELVKQYNTTPKTSIVVPGAHAV